jgi:sulfur-carrier protein
MHMSLRVHLAQMLVRHLCMEAELSVEAGTVEELLDKIEADHQGFRDSVCDESGCIRTYVNIFVNSRVLERGPRALSTRLSEADEVHILASVAGG